MVIATEPLTTKKIGLFHTAFIGDLVLMSLLIEALHQAGHHIILITTLAGQKIYFDDPRVREIIVVEKKKKLKKLSYIFETSKKIKETKLDICICPHVSATSSIICHLSGTPVTIGFSHAALSRLYKTRVQVDHSLHESKRVLSMANSSIVQKDILDQLFKIGRPILNGLKTPESIHSLPASQFITVFPGSVWPTKIYPATHYAKVIECLLNKSAFSHLSIAICGGESDRKESNIILDYLHEKKLLSERVLDLTAKIDLSKLKYLVARSACVVANDSAPIHFAAGMNTPCIAIFGPTSPKFGFGPSSSNSLLLEYRAQHKTDLPCHPCGIHGHRSCPMQHHRCMIDLSPDFVANKIAKFIQEL